MLSLGVVLAAPQLVACHPPETVAPPKPRRRRKPRPKPAPSVAQILAASELPPLRPVADPDDPMGVTVHRLSNGLTVYVSPDSTLRRVETAIAVRAGSRHDPGDATGLAHYLEHMLFKGSDELGTTDIEAERPHLETIAALYAELRQTEDPQRRGEIFADIDRETVAASAYAIPNELDRVYAALGIEDVNAYTSDEVTAYISSVPNHRLEAWAQLEAERFIDAEFRLFWPELEAVYEEKNAALDSPEERVWHAVRRGLFPAHPYGQNDVLGRVEHLRNPAYLEMADYFRRWYAPNNAAIFLVGDVDPDVVIPQIEAAFAEWRPRSLSVPDGGTLGPPATPREVEIAAPGAESVTLAWRTVPAAHDDAAAVQVMDLLMDNARTGLLNVKLGIPQVVPSVGSWGEQLNESGYWVVSAEAKRGQSLAVVEKLLQAVVDDLREGEFDAEDLRAVAINERIDRSRRLESPQARIELMTEAFVGRRPWPAPLEAVDRLERVTKADVIRVANSYLDDDYVTIRRVDGDPHLPRVQKPEITPLSIKTDRHSDFATRLLDVDDELPEPRWLVNGEHYVTGKRRTKGARAPRWVSAENRRNDLFAAHYRVDRGFREAPLSCLALALLEVSGRRGPAGDVSAEELRHELYAMGVDVTMRCDAERTEIRIEGPLAARDEALTLVRGWITAPLLDPGTLDALRQNIRTDRTAALEDPRRLAWALRDFSRYGPRSAWLAQPSNARLARATVRDLGRELDRLRRHEAQLTYFGPDGATLDGEQLTLFDGRRNAKPPPRREFRNGGETRIFVVDAPVAKSIVHVTFPAGTHGAEDRAAAELYSTYLEGDMSALLFQEVREARGLAYAVSGAVTTGERPDDEWALDGSMGTQTDKTVQAIALYLDLVRPDAEAGLDPGRYETALAALDSSYRSAHIEARHVPEVVADWFRAGFEEDPRPQRWSQLRSLDRAAALNLAVRLTESPALISVVGDIDELDMEGLRTLGEVIVVTPDQLYGFGSFDPR